MIPPAIGNMQTGLIMIAEAESANAATNLSGDGRSKNQTIARRLAIISMIIGRSGRKLTLSWIPLGTNRKYTAATQAASVDASLRVRKKRKTPARNQAHIAISRGTANVSRPSTR